jgi:hypothetical protein
MGAKVVIDGKSYPATKRRRRQALRSLRATLNAPTRAARVVENRAERIGRETRERITRANERADRRGGFM